LTAGTPNPGKGVCVGSAVLVDDVNVMSDVISGGRGTVDESEPADNGPFDVSQLRPLNVINDAETIVVPPFPAIVNANVVVSETSAVIDGLIGGDGVVSLSHELDGLVAGCSRS
jgi:hypothetical protein